MARAGRRFVGLQLAGGFGRRRIFQMALGLFALGLVLSPLAGSPIPFVITRIVQGTAGGLLVPLAMATLFETYPPTQRARLALAVGASGLLGISSGPGIGGWLCEFHGWPAIFYFSLPLVAAIFLVITLWGTEKQAAQKPRFDFFGFATFSLGLIGLQLVLDRGERLEWFAAKEIWAEAIEPKVKELMK